MRGSAGSADAACAKSVGRIPTIRRPAGTSLSGRERQLVAREAHDAVADVGLDEVHRRRADERRHEQVRGTPEQRLRRVDLLQDAVAQHGDALAERHRLDLVMRHVDRRHAETVVQTRELTAHRDAQLGIEVRERLVHEERLRLAHHRPAHRDALALAARELAGLAVEELLEPELRRDVPDPPGALRLRDLAQLEREPEVLADRHVRVQGVVLEDHRDVALARRTVGHVFVAEDDAPARHLLEPRDHPQQRRLPAPRRADEDHELAVGDLESHVVDRLDAAVEDLRHVLDPDASRHSTATDPWNAFAGCSSAGTTVTEPTVTGVRGGLSDEHLDLARLDDIRRALDRRSRAGRPGRGR